MNSMLTLEEVKNYLEADQKQIEEYIRIRKLQAYKIGGTFLRFRKEEVLNLRSELFTVQKPSTEAKVTIFSRIADFWRFNNFYIISILIIAALAVYVVKT